MYRNSLAIMLNTASTSIFGLVYWIVAAHTMETAEIGFATAVISATGLISTLANFGLDAGLIRYLPQMEAQDRNKLYNTVITVTLLAALIIAVIFMAFIDQFSPSLAFIREGWFSVMFIGYIALTSVSYLQCMTFTALRRADLSLAQSLINGIRIPLLFVFAPLGIIGVLLSINISFVVSVLFGSIALLKYKLSYLFKLDIPSIRKTVNFSLWNYTAGILLMAQGGIIPIIIINTIGPKENAYFYVAFAMSSFLFMIPAAVSTSLFVEGSYDLPLQENVVKSLKFILVLLIPSALVLFLFGDKILLLFSSEYSRQSFELLQLLAIASIFSITVSIFTAIKRVQKGVKMINFINTFISVLILGLGYYLLTQYGLIGLGYAWLISNIIVGAFIILYTLTMEKWVRIPILQRQP